MNEEQHIMKNMSNQSSHSFVKMNALPNKKQENVCHWTGFEVFQTKKSVRNTSTDNVPHIEAIMHIPQTVTLTVVKKGMEHKGEKR